MSSNHLIIGLGGTGGKIIRSLRKTIYQEFRSVDPTGVNIEYLYVDSSDEMMGPDDATWRVLGRSVQLGNNSQLLITDANLQSRLDNIENYPGIKDWIGSKEEWSNILRSIVGVTLGGQKRRLGRFLFACKAEQFKQQLQTQVRQLQTRGEISVTFHICAGLAGGTGSGSIIDAISQVRDTYPDAKTYRIIVYCLLPDKYPKPNWDTGNYHANGYAALMELNALSVGAWQPHDVTGVKGRLQLSDPFNGCYLFTNENENGLFVDVGSEVPNIIASFLYQKLVAVKNVQWETIRRMENAENGDGTPETSPGAKTGQRSKRFLTFGIKRLAIPEEEIREYLTFQFARQAALQLQFNNWSDALSFADEPRRQSYQEIVKQADTLQKWLISDDHLRLSIGILPDEQKNPRWKPINQSWQDVLAQFKSFVRETYKDRPRVWLDELGMLCEKRYASEYRELGVARFYETKKGDRKEHLREIRARIERELIEDWRNGVQSMADSRRLIDALIASLQERLNTVDDKIAMAMKNEESAANRVIATSKQWAGMNFVTSFFQRDQLFDQQGNNLQEQYVYRTQSEAWRFAKGLLQALVSELTTLQAEVDRAASMIGEATDAFNKAIETRCNDAGMTDVKQQLVKFYDPAAVKDFARTLVRDREQQMKQTKAVRDALLAPLGDNPSFPAFNSRITRERFIDMLEAKCEENAVEAHQLLVSSSRDRQRLLGDSIVERLYQQFGGDIEQVQRYIRELVAMAGNYIAFKSEEVGKTGEGIPAGVPTRITNFTIIRPVSQSRPEFSDALDRAFRSSSTVPNMEFIPSKDIPSEVKPNEITLISVTNLFPLRYLEQTAFLRQKYEQRTSGERAGRAKLEIHGEGDGRQFPPIYVPSSQEVVDEGLPYVLLGRAMNVIQTIENPSTGIKSLALVTKDEYGFDNDPVLLGANIIEAAGKLNAAATRTIRTEVDKLLNGPDYIHIDRRTELQKSILTLVESIKAERGNNVQDEVYRKFLDAGRKAVLTVRPKD